MALAVLVAIGMRMGRYWMGQQLTSQESGFTMKRRQSLGIAASGTASDIKCFIWCVDIAGIPGSTTVGVGRCKVLRHNVSRIAVIRCIMPPGSAGWRCFHCLTITYTDKYRTAGGGSLT